MSDAYYNEHDPFAAAWLKELIRAGHIAPGEVDTRSIVDVRLDDLRGFGQCHFFAGIGVWSYALRSAGWADDRPIWTGSCPCQPFSGAGKRTGLADERHLWPVFFNLIRECRPGVVVGEQVANKAGLEWFDVVQADLESADYASGAVDLCAAGLGAPHIRQRLYWLAYADQLACGQGRAQPGGLVARGDAQSWSGFGQHGGADVMADASGARLSVREPAELRGARRRRKGRAVEQCSGASDALADALGRQLPEPERESQGRDGDGSDRADAAAGPTDGFWRAADWLACRDGRWRPVESGTFPLAHGAPARVGRLRGYGNALVAPVAQAFIEAVMETVAWRASR